MSNGIFMRFNMSIRVGIVTRMVDHDYNHGHHDNHELFYRRLDRVIKLFYSPKWLSISFIIYRSANDHSQFTSLCGLIFHPVCDICRYFAFESRGSMKGFVDVIVQNKICVHSSLHKNGVSLKILLFLYPPTWSL